MNILSIDWDYFFPDVIPYDWGHKESGIFYEMAWHWRPGNRNLITNEIALDTVVPSKERLKDFWKKVCPKTSKFLIIAESHLDILQIGKIFKESTIWNFDQHHDLCYGDKQPTKPDCGSWAGHLIKEGVISEYNVVYPEWRKQEPENIPEIKANYYYEIPENLPEFDIVFICRSYAWTPTWADPEWIKFIEHWKKHSFLWDSKIISESVLNKRSPGNIEARKIMIETEKQRKELEKEPKNKTTK